MKLEKLFESSIDFSKIKNGASADVFEVFEESMKTLTKGMVFDRQQSLSDGHLSFFFHNGLVEMQVLTYISTKKTEEQYINVGVKVDVNEKLLIEGADNSTTLINAFAYFDNSRPEFEMKKMEAINASIQEFADWYFDISGEYGKVKLIGGTHNLVDGYSRGGEQRFTAVAGDFHCESDGSNSEAQKRIF